MIHIVDAANRHLYAHELDQMHRLRAKFFCDTLGWGALTVVDGREVDAYDDELAIYLLAIEDDGEISVSVRLRPTADRSLLLDHFPHLCAEDPNIVAHVGVWESCRYFATPRVRGAEGAKRREELRLAMVELANAHGIERIVAITDTVFLPPLLQSSWTTRLMGLPSPYAEGECVALEISCREEALLRMQERLGQLQPTLFRYEEQDAALGLRPHEFEALIRSAGKSSATEIEVLLEAAQQLRGDDLATVAKIVNAVASLESQIGADELLTAVQAIKLQLRAPLMGKAQASRKSDTRPR